LPLGLPSAVWSSLSELHWPHLSNAVKSTRRACLPESLTQSHLAASPQRTSSSHGLPLPTAHEASKVRLPRALPTPAIFRLQGLATLLTVYALRNRAGLVSYRQRSWDSPFGAFSSREVSGPFPARKNPHAVSLACIPLHRSAGAGSASRSSWALTLSRVPGDQAPV
jgi:hypothetical protein